MEVSFAELDADPVAALQRVYTGLGLGDFEAARPAVQAHVAGLQLAGFKKNAHRWGRRRGTLQETGREGRGATDARKWAGQWPW